MSGKHEKMDWAGEAGDKFAKWNKFDAEGQDTMYMDIYGVKQSDMLKK